MANAATGPIASVFFRQRQFRNVQVTSQIRIAAVVTPESGPVGLKKMSALLIEANLSAAMARTARAKEPMPAERMAAAPEPFVRTGALDVAKSLAALIFLRPG